MLPPGSRLPKLVQTALMWTRPLPRVRALQRRYGDVFTMNVAPFGQVAYLADPDEIKRVFAGDVAVFHAGEANSLMRGLLGDSSVLLVDEQEHRDRRRQMLPPFHREAVRRQSELMAEIARADVASWPVGRQFPVAPRMAAITLEVILRTVVGADDPRRLARLRAALPKVTDMSLLGVWSMANPELLRHPLWRRVRRERAEAERLVYAEIAAGRAELDAGQGVGLDAGQGAELDAGQGVGPQGRADGRVDVLAMLMRSVDSAGLRMTDRQLRDQLMTLLLAGHETTATGLSWALERLVRHPELLRRAVAAADAGDDGDEYLDAVVKETLRCRPVISEVGRVLTRPTEVAGYLLPAGTMVAPAIALVHANPSLYPSPERFDPDRMLGVTPPPTTWLPFGGGARRCLGATFAQVEMRVVLREILRAVHLETTDAPPERQRIKHVTLVPSRGARIRVLGRRRAASSVRVSGPTSAREGV